MAPLGIAELSLCGLISRLKEARRVQEACQTFLGSKSRSSIFDQVEHVKGIKSPDDEQAFGWWCRLTAAILSTETDAKKALFEQLQAVRTDGVASFEKKVAKEFLQGQLKSIDDSTKGAEAKRSKLQDLLTGLEAAATRDDPAHVRRARQDVTKAEKAFEDIRKDYERWEKGKKMLTVDEIKVLKRSFEDSKAKVEKVRAVVEEQQLRRAEAAVAPVVDEKERGAAALAAEARASRARAVASKAPARPTNPSVSSKASPAGGYPPKAVAVAPAALRQAQVAAQVRTEAAEAQQSLAPAPAPRPRPAPRPQAEDAPVLSYACTLTAVAQHLGVTEAQAKELAESAREFARHFDAETWEAIQERSLAIEKANQEKQREAERRKKEKALAKVTQVQSSAAAGGAGAVAAKATAKAVPQAVVGRPDSVPNAKPKAKPKATAKVPPRQDGLKSLAGANKFGGLESDDEEEGWAKVRR
ncbi:MGAT4C [Symbiodinium natans]|uniref:MGAT4C protein n=1 Tax=Symbiodinium natans TaxID=878477 RepID=A0A812R426_9DINO|nr:MGAT4C [Symbiodinium natans]